MRDSNCRVHPINLNDYHSIRYGSSIPNYPEIHKQTSIRSEPKQHNDSETKSH